MKKTLPISLALAATFAAGPAPASDMFLDLTAFGGNVLDIGQLPPPLQFLFFGNGDANTTTGVFNEFSFGQMLATSIYDMSDGSPLGAFYDTNVVGNGATPNTLEYAGIPALGVSGTALDGLTQVSLSQPICGAQCDIDGLEPLVPPTNSDSEGFLGTWDLQVQFTFFGTLSATGPVYTSGTIDVYFNDLQTATLYDSLALSASLTGSEIESANLKLFFDITFSAPDFLWIDNGSGFVSASDAIAGGGVPTLRLDTNVDPAIPTLDQLLLVVDAGSRPNAIRQARLDGSVTAAIPEPTTLALLGLGVLGLGVGSRRGRKTAA